MSLTTRAKSRGIAIVGGGIAGLVASRVLNRHQYVCTIIEPRTELTLGGAGLVLWPAAVRALSQLGFSDVLGLGTPLRESILRDTKGRTLLRIPLAFSRDRQPHALTRQSLMRLLNQDQCNPILAKSCTDISDVEHRPVLTFSDGTRMEAGGVIVAAGMNSTLRQSVSPNAQPRDCHRTSWRGVAPIEDERLAGGTGIETLGLGCRVGLFPAGNGFSYWFVQQNLHADGLIAKPSARAWLEERLRSWPEPIARIIAATPEESIVETPISEMLPQPRWQRGNALLIGDAAHGMAPDLGRGACAAIVNLLAFDCVLSKYESFSQAAHSYVKARRRVSWVIQHASRLAGSLRQIENRFLYTVRNTLWRFLPPLLLFRLIVPLLTKRLKKRS